MPRAVLLVGEEVPVDVGAVEAIRALLMAKRSCRSVRTKTLNQIRHLGFCAPDALRERLAGLSPDEVAAEAASLRPRSGGDPVVLATKVHHDAAREFEVAVSLQRSWAFETLELISRRRGGTPASDAASVSPSTRRASSGRGVCKVGGSWRWGRSRQRCGVLPLGEAIDHPDTHVMGSA